MDENRKQRERPLRRLLQSQNHLDGVDLAFPKLSPKSHSEDNRPNATVPAGHRTLGWQSIALSLSGNRTRNAPFSAPKQGEQHTTRNYIRRIAEWNPGCCLAKFAMSQYKKAPAFAVGVSRCKTTLTEKERLNESRKVYRHGRSLGRYFRCRDGCSWQIDHGMRAGNQGIHHRRVHARTAGNFVRDRRLGNGQHHS